MWTSVRPARAVRPRVRPAWYAIAIIHMDLATLLGYLLAWGVLIYGMFHATHGQLGAYVNPGELLLVVGCAFGAAMASMPLHSVLSAFKCTKKMLFSKEMHIEHLIKEMVQYAETARRDGVLALESVAREAPDPFLRRGLQLTIDGTDPEIIERIMRIEVESMLERHKHGKHFWGMIAQFGPGLSTHRITNRPIMHMIKSASVKIHSGHSSQISWGSHLPHFFVAMIHRWFKSGETTADTEDTERDSELIG